jgi:hypothetical protein
VWGLQKNRVCVCVCVCAGAPQKMAHEPDHEKDRGADMQASGEDIPAEGAVTLACQVLRIAWRPLWLQWH